LEIRKFGFTGLHRRALIIPANYSNIPFVVFYVCVTIRDEHFSNKKSHFLDVVLHCNSFLAQITHSKWSIKLNVSIDR